VREAPEITKLNVRIEAQQVEIDRLRRTLEEQGAMLARIVGSGSNGMTPPAAAIRPAPEETGSAIPAAAPQTPAAPAQTDSKLDALSKAVDTINANLRGFRFSGDFRYRLDMQLRSSNEFAGPLQNIRGRYRLRLNFDKDVAPGLSAHAQLSTGPYNVPTTNDQDFAALGAKHPFSVAEGWMKYSRKSFSVRGGRMEEVFADNSRFLWDDDIRLNGFDARYTASLPSSASLEFRLGAYILTNPNTLVVPGSPYQAIGYQVGQKVRDAMLFHPGFVLRARQSGWAHQWYGDFLWYRHPEQIQLASTANGAPVLAGNALGLTLSGPLAASGNALAAPGSALLAARHWQIAHGGWRSDFGDFKLGKTSMPFWVDFQGALNTGTGSDRAALMASVNLGNTRKFGDVRFLYQFAYKQANALISQFTDDDLGTGTGVNIRVHAIRFDLGLTRFLAWQNLLFVQDPIEGNRPGFFVTLPKGANTTFRYLGQLAFSF